MAQQSSRLASLSPELIEKILVETDHEDRFNCLLLCKSMYAVASGRPLYQKLVLDSSATATPVLGAVTRHGIAGRFIESIVCETGCGDFEGGKADRWKRIAIISHVTLHLICKAPNLTFLSLSPVSRPTIGSIITALLSCHAIAHMVLDHAASTSTHRCLNWMEVAKLVQQLASLRNVEVWHMPAEDFTFPANVLHTIVLSNCDISNDQIAQLLSASGSSLRNLECYRMRTVDTERLIEAISQHCRHLVSLDVAVGSSVNIPDRLERWLEPLEDLEELLLFGPLLAPISLWTISSNVHTLCLGVSSIDVGWIASWMGKNSHTPTRLRLLEDTYERSCLKEIGDRTKTAVSWAALESELSLRS